MTLQRRLMAVLALVAAGTLLAACTASAPEPGSSLPEAERTAAQEALETGMQSEGYGALGDWVTSGETASVSTVLPAGVTGFAAACHGEGDVDISWGAGASSTQEPAERFTIACDDDTVQVPLPPLAVDGHLLMVADRAASATDTTWWVVLDGPPTDENGS